MKVAVYGTLRKGFGNHRLLEQAKYEGTSRVEGFNLYDLGYYPGIKTGAGSVVVESYSDYDLEALDALEGEGSLYKREVVQVDGEDHYIYVYMHPVDFDSEIKSGDYQSF